MNTLVSQTYEKDDEHRVLTQTIEISLHYMCIYLCKRHVEQFEAGHKRKQKQAFELNDVSL